MSICKSKELYYLMMMLQGEFAGGEVVELSKVVAELKNLQKLAHSQLMVELSKKNNLI